MSWLFFAIGTAVLWGTAELFYKKGALPSEKYSHLKICIWVGIVMGAHAIFTLLTQDINYNPINIIRYLPVSLFYIISMAFSYFGMRFLEESISDPIENTAGVICCLLFAIFMKEEIAPLTWIAIGVITVGVLGVSFLENHGETTRKKKLGKTLAVIAFCMPFVYALLDAFGTFLDDAFFLIEDATKSPLVNVTADTIEDVANTSYELTFALFALILFIFMKIKKVKFGPIPQHKDKILAAVALLRSYLHTLPSCFFVQQAHNASGNANSTNYQQQHCCNNPQGLILFRNFHTGNGFGFSHSFTLF